MKDRILIVDDDVFALRLLEKHLQIAGYDVVSSLNARDALRILHTEGASIVITDSQMPDMDGLTLCRAIRELEVTGFVYIIIVTAEEDSACVVQAFDAGVDDYLRKPFNPSELVARLKAARRILALQDDLARQQRAIHKYNAEMAVLNDQLEQMATIDELTGLANRRQGLKRLAEEWAISRRRQLPLACMMIDIDHFKTINDRHGHDVGDLVLKHTAKVLKNASRPGQFPCRLGGEEFLVLCTLAAAEEVIAQAERLRSLIEAAPMEIAGQSTMVTVSIGVAMYERECPSHESLLRRADQAMYAAKRQGRNRVYLSESQQPLASKAASV